MDESTEFLHLILSGNDEGYNTTTEFQVWDVLDFYVTENLSSLQFDSLMGFTNEVSTSYNYSDCMNLVDMVERPVARLSLDDTPEPNNTSNEVPVDHTTLDPDETSLYLQTKPTDSETECSSSATGDVVETEYLDQKLLSRGLPDLMDVDSPSRLTKTPVRTKHVTLVLDLDGEQALTSHYAILLLTFFLMVVLNNLFSLHLFCYSAHFSFVDALITMLLFPSVCFCCCHVIVIFS
jgi:CTD small phosphatase-like protein 2